MRTISFDGVIVGGGGAGMRAALQLAQSGYKTAVISKVFPDAFSHRIGAGRHYLRHRQFRPQ
jgi:succinate dehydrogenase / fumarate reductase flavoprotein subunit